MDSRRPFVVAALVATFLAPDTAAGTPNEIKLVDSNGSTGDSFGGGGSSSQGGPGVVSTGDVIVVGSWNDDVDGTFSQGSASVFRWDGFTWVEEPKLTAAGGSASDNLGWAVSASGDWIVAGAPGDDVGGNVDQGSVTVFRWNGASWVEETVLTSSLGGAGDYLGTSVALDGDVLVAGAFEDDIGPASRQGSATVFRWNGASWAEETVLTDSNGAANDQFGCAVGVSGDVIVVGSYLDDLGPNANQGSAVVFRWNGASWVEEVKLTAAGGETNDHFGTSVSVSGDVLVVGTRLDDVDGNTDEGSATVFRWNGAAWLEEATLAPDSGAAGDQRGRGVAVAGDTVVVGAPRDDVEGVVTGSAAVFRWNGASWVEEFDLAATDGAASDVYGSSCALTPTGTVVVASPQSDVGGSAFQGAAYVYDVGVSPWTDLGAPLAGSLGDPLLVGSGTMVAGCPVTVALSSASPSSFGAVFLSVASTPAPFKCGTLQTVPPVLTVFLVTSPTGDVVLRFASWPAGIPAGVEFYWQFVIQDGGAPCGFAISNGLRGTQP